MNPFKKLLGQTAIYGLPSILGRFLNYCLVFLHTNIFVTSNYGVQNYFYAIAAFMAVVLTYGMETAYFRYTSLSDNKDRVFSTAQARGIVGNLTTDIYRVERTICKQCRRAIATQIQCRAEAFSDCNNLTTITSHAAVPPICGTQALDDINKWSCTLRVPSGYAAAYQAADQWKEFFFIEDVVEVELYVLTYVVDGEVYHTDTLAHKATIAQPEMPVKEGYTFNGWSEIPATMPANDVTISGTFTINKYLVTFQIGEEVVAVDSLEYGATIAVPEAPEKEGYTFDGWGEVADIVPAYDVTYEGTYTVNVYKVYYYVGEELVYTAEVAYGESIPEYVYEPTAEGDVFEGWVGETYGTMPAHDVTYTANITNGIGKSEIKNEKLEIIYDLQGRRVLSTDNLKGIYIINGKRVVIK